MTDDRLCLHCGEPASAHHEFEAEAERPPGCVCPPGEWGAHVFDICDWYSGDGKMCCRLCWHDAACHRRTPGEGAA